MMLQALYALAVREGLLDDPDYEKRQIDFQLRIDDEGRVQSLESLRDDKGRRRELMVPRGRVRAGAKIVPFFASDKALYVLGIAEPSDGASEKQSSRSEECVQAFRKLIDDLAQETGDEAALAVSRFYCRRTDELPKIFKRRPREEWTGSENIVFVLSADSERLHERPKVREYWSRRRSQESDGAAVRCLVTGLVGPPAVTHNKVKRVPPRGQAAGVSLVSFNQEAFRSHGFMKGENAPVSRAAAEGYVTALNWLMEDGKTRRYRSGVALGDDAVAVFWTREKTDTADILAEYFGPDPEEVRKHLEAPFKGRAPSDLDDSAFYAVTLSGNAAPVVVRDWLETTVAEIKHNVGRFFEDLQIGDEPAPLPLRSLLGALAGPRGTGVPPQIATRFFGAALRGQPFPRELLPLALRRLRIPRKGSDRPRLVREQLHARCSLIKATLLRLPRSGLSTMEVTVSLDEKNTQVPYLLGRLFATMERLQRAALGNVNATIRDRYFGSAMAHPAVVFPRLIALANHHAAKAKNAGWLARVMGQIVAGLPPKRFPNALALEDQGLFAIGYYHQRERFFQKAPAGSSEAPAAN